jgi:hypothetical protein
MLRPIQTEKGYEAAKERAQELMQMHLQPGTAEAEELEVRLILIARYETRGPIISFAQDGKTWVNNIFLDFGADESNLSASFD